MAHVTVCPSLCEQSARIQARPFQTVARTDILEGLAQLGEVHHARFADAVDPPCHLGLVVHLVLEVCLDGLREGRGQGRQHTKKERNKQTSYQLRDALNLLRDKRRLQGVWGGWSACAGAQTYTHKQTQAGTHLLRVEVVHSRCRLASPPNTKQTTKPQRSLSRQVDPEEQTNPPEKFSAQSARQEHRMP